MRLLHIILSLVLGGVIPAGKTFIEPLQKRDSILVADQIEYGFVLDSVGRNCGIALPDFSGASSDTLTLVRDWKLDTLNLRNKKQPAFYRIRASIVLAPFEEGTYHLPDLPVALSYASGKTDTLLFEASEMEVKTIPVDTATFEMHPLKGIIRYPLTFRELLPYFLGLLILAALIVLAVYLVRRFARKKGTESHADPAHIVALRKLDSFRDPKFWAPERQKAFYSGVTDALKEYIDSRFGVDAPEMTTAELFDALKPCGEITPEQYSELKSLFEEADFVKFAKFTAPDEDNAKVLPCAVRFVTETYQSEIDKEQTENEKGGDA